MAQTRHRWTLSAAVTAHYTLPVFSVRDARRAVRQFHLKNPEYHMSVAKVIEIIANSKVSFDDAVRQGVSRASDTLHDITAAWVKDQSVIVSAGKVTEYRVTMKVTFLLKGGDKPARGKKK
jgi:dodecin